MLTRSCWRAARVLALDSAQAEEVSVSRQKGWQTPSSHYREDRLAGCQCPERAGLTTGTFISTFVAALCRVPDYSG